jgi:hypothetical protein
MHENNAREELVARGICVQEVMQLRLERRDQNPEKDRPVTPHFTVTVARGSKFSKIRSITELCGIRVTVETYTAIEGLCNASEASVSATPSVTVVTGLSVWRVARITCHSSAQPPRSSLNAAAAVVNTPPTTGGAGRGKRLRRIL